MNQKTVYWLVLAAAVGSALWTYRFFLTIPELRLPRQEAFVHGLPLVLVAALAASFLIGRRGGQP